MFNYTRLYTFFLYLFLTQRVLSQTLPQGVTFNDIFSPFPGQRITSLLGLIDYRDVSALQGVAAFPSIIAGGLAGEISRYDAPRGIPVIQGTEVLASFAPTDSTDFSRISLARFPGRYVRQMAFDTAAVNPDFFVVGKSGIVARYSQNRITSIFAPFPGVDAKSIAVDSIGRPIVGGKNKTIVRYNRNGQIGLTFQDFAPLNRQNNAAYSNVVNGLAIDYNSRIIAVGKNGLVIRYLSNGQIDRVYQSFPGRIARGVVVDTLNRAYVCGDRGVVVRYSQDGSIERRFQRFPGLIARSLVFLPYFNVGRFPPDRPVLVVVGNSGSVVTYANNGQILPTLGFFTPEEVFQTGNLPFVSNIGSFVGVRATSAALLGVTFEVGGNRDINTLGSMQQYFLDVQSFMFPPMISTIENANSGVCSEVGTEITVPAGIINIRGSVIEGSLISLFVNGQLVASTTNPDSSTWVISRPFGVGTYRIEVANFYPPGNFRINSIRFSEIANISRFDSFVNLVVVPVCP